MLKPRSKQEAVVSFTTANSPTRFFSVVGPAYVEERHADRSGHLAARSDLEAVETGVSGLWVAFFAAIGVSLINNSQTAKALQVAATALH
jgi:hypothetical protein